MPAPKNSPATTIVSSDDPNKPAAVGPSEELNEDQKSEILESDSRDNSPRGPEPDTSGKRVRAIPATITKSTGNATRIEVRREDFQRKGIDHATVVFDQFRDNYTVAVGSGDNQLSQEAADYLTKNHPTSFEFMGD